MHTPVTERDVCKLMLSYLLLGGLVRLPDWFRLSSLFFLLQWHYDLITTSTLLRTATLAVIAVLANQPTSSVP